MVKLLDSLPDVRNSSINMVGEIGKLTDTYEFDRSVEI